jgi:HAD superfamily hydrolase (TIGR01459 family)
VLERLLELRAKSKKVVLLSNSGKPSHVNVERLRTFGVLPNLYDDFVTSGEIAQQNLKNRANPFFQKIGKRCMAFVRGGDTAFLSELDLEYTRNIDDATFLLMSGVDEDDNLIEKLNPVLRAAASKNLPMICTNPDFHFLLGDKYYLGSGTIAKAYEEMGQQVLYIGKPHLEIFTYALKRLNLPNTKRILMVGDSLAHDIKGANIACIDSVLVTDGLHKQEIENSKSGEIDFNAFEKLCRKHEAKPDWLVRSFG